MPAPFMTPEGVDAVMRFADLVMRNVIQPEHEPGYLGLSTHAHLLNLSEGIPWNLRERIRTIEGLSDRIEEELIELVSRLGTDNAEAFIEEHCPTED